VVLIVKEEGGKYVCVHAECPEMEGKIPEVDPSCSLEKVRKFGLPIHGEKFNA
jgi:hypothetical protein